MRIFDAKHHSNPFLGLLSIQMLRENSAQHRVILMQKHLLIQCPIHLFIHNSSDTLKTAWGFSDESVYLGVQIHVFMPKLPPERQTYLFIFCQLALNFCLLYPNSQLGKTLIDSCEIQSVSAHFFLETWWLYELQRKGLVRKRGQ